MPAETPGTIFAEIEACPPLMRDDAKTKFIGREVDWTLVFANGWQESADLARLTFRQERGVVEFVAASVPLTECPWLKHMHAGEIMRVRGHIAELTRMTIELKGASVSQVVEAAR